MQVNFDKSELQLQIATYLGELKLIKCFLTDFKLFIYEIKIMQLQYTNSYATMMQI